MLADGRLHHFQVRFHQGVGLVGEAPGDFEEHGDDLQIGMFPNTAGTIFPAIPLLASTTTRTFRPNFMNFSTCWR